VTDAIDVEVVDTTPVVGQQTAMVSTADPYMGMAQMAMSQGKIAEMKELLAMKREWDAEEARKAFTAAMAAFKKKGLVVGKDKENKQYGSMYTTLGNLVNTASAVMAEFGLTVDWDIDQSSSTIKVTCVLEHEAGHSKRVTMIAEPDKSGAKNPIQQVKSAVTYLRGATFEAVTGIATSESAGINRDDDGNGFGEPELPAKDSAWIDSVKVLTDYPAYLEMKKKMLADYGGKADQIPNAVRDAFNRVAEATKPRD
jgi:hypothetical protein